MKIIFLDIDGVLVPCVKDVWTFQEEQVKLLKEVIEERNYKIVISSSWRIEGITHPRSQLRNELEKSGLMEHLYRPDWHTPNYNAEPCLQGDDTIATKRPREIDLYLQRRPEVKEYLILDDDEWEFSEEQKPHVIRTDSIKGLTKEDIEKHNGV
jgi:hypothetical protein